MAKKASKKRKAGLPRIALPLFQPGTINLLGATQHRKIVRSKVAESVYTLSDGTKLALKPLIADVRRAVGQFNANGHPVYFLTVANSIETHPPKALLKKQTKVAKKSS
jgi:hypothetical protein